VGVEDLSEDAVRIAGAIGVDDVGVAAGIDRTGDAELEVAARNRARDRPSRVDGIEAGDVELVRGVERAGLAGEEGPGPAVGGGDEQLRPGQPDAIEGLFAVLVLEADEVDAPLVGAGAAGRKADEG
jgi:hypothetical protein